MFYLNEANIDDNMVGEESTEQLDKVFVLALRNAIKNDELSIAYQPRYDTKDGKCHILEALVRWPRKGIGILYPNAFIDEAIKYGLIYELDLWVFKQSCRDLIELRKHIDSNIKIAINITPLECESLHHTQKLIYICESSGLKLSDFEFEITESTHTNDIRKIKTFCKTVINYGAAISLDDFGTCYSPLSNLCDLPVDYIKIDRSFTNKIGLRTRSNILVNHLIRLAHEMEIKVVAEGIEHAFQRDLLMDMGCDQLQGFYMCKPLTSKQITPSNIVMQY
ncbi:MAG: hypothetical protein COA54_02140 [Thiotrichaceae bacterium]|nr:MAG: hypothetical protein COA54_02140 [Thiotrichaceae bacterium]